MTAENVVGLVPSREIGSVVGKLFKQKPVRCIQRDHAEMAVATCGSHL